ncbi:hypothetical protein [Nonomuraea sp. SYSU D8015]|uniref:hypothetical protein n=1 Tax=Nonomuraea sp. SYSU D8015 TaxID=2593644 RepID=UPI001660F8A7|nr:hypothetical protein [Nonomuraea sp. SYSU D8015]
MPTVLLPGDSTQRANASSATIPDPDDRAVHSGWKDGPAEQRHRPAAARSLTDVASNPVEVPVHVSAFDIGQN